jgi:hypothetical protein
MLPSQISSTQFKSKIKPTQAHLSPAVNLLFKNNFSREFPEYLNQVK